ncbi:MAG: FecR family protein [Sphingobium sp.]|uniref:FecR family protein n=1 Tax=Sphingobium sp. TaxID=1912891 RepID=UPI0029A7212F|nr:FecR family protein [Sphingobium sp.]MDX3911703.1 FecR family protein [Sphingobium sp.]
MAAEQRIPEEIRQEAARWIAERDAGLLTPGDEKARAAWLAADPLHATAYARLERTWSTMGSVPVKAEIHRRSTVLPFRLPARSRQWLGGAVAACLALAIVGTAQDWPTRLRADAMTATGERREVVLTDGSRVELNTASAIMIDYRSERRIIHLLKGEAAFTVAADRTRPFTVEAGDGATTALGTRFIVRREGADTDVTVTEHRVRVARAAEAATPAWIAIVSEGEASRYGPGGIIAPHAVDIDAAAAWTRGRLVLVDRPLGDVVAELNRYHRGYIRVVGEALAERRFSGVLPVDDPIGSLDAIQRSLGISSTRITDRLIFLHS